MAYPKRSPKIPRLLDILAEWEVNYILIGSVACQVYGAEVQPGDLDITPALNRENLERLAGVLQDIEAWPSEDFGYWGVQSGGEKRWIKVTITPERLAAREAWQPNPSDVTSLDHLFLTRYGNFDVVPHLLGSYEMLGEKAVRTTIHGYEVWVAHVDDLLATLTVPRRKKDTERVKQLRIIQRNQMQRTVDRRKV